MTLVENNAFTIPGNSIRDITTYFIGAVLSTGGGGRRGRVVQLLSGRIWWTTSRAMRSGPAWAFRSSTGPMRYHGHNNVYGATLFPHNIGLGAMHDPALITRVEQVTRDEMLGTGVRWTFAPCLCTPQDIRWGRTYEGYSEVPSDTATDGAAAIVGFQGPNGELPPMSWQRLNTLSVTVTLPGAPAHRTSTLGMTRFPNNSWIPLTSRHTSRLSQTRSVQS